MIEYNLKPNQSHDEDFWHVVGLPQEDIVLTAMYVLEAEEGIVGGDLLLKRPFFPDEVDYTKDISESAMYRDEPRSDATMLGVKDGLTPLGKVELIRGRLVVFPNCHVTKMTRMTNHGATPSRKTVVLFHLVNPLRRILSTREIEVSTSSNGSDDAIQERMDIMREQIYDDTWWNVITMDRL